MVEKDKCPSFDTAGTRIIEARSEMSDIASLG